MFYFVVRFWIQLLYARTHGNDAKRTCGDLAIWIVKDKIHARYVSLNGESEIVPCIDLVFFFSLFYCFASICFRSLTLRSPSACHCSIDLCKNNNNNNKKNKYSKSLVVVGRDWTCFESRISAVLFANWKELISIYFMRVVCVWVHWGLICSHSKLRDWFTINWTDIFCCHNSI